jgi:hypothetical protein
MQSGLLAAAATQQTGLAMDKLRKLAHETARQQLRQRKRKAQALLDLLTKNSAKDEQPTPSYGGDRVLAAIMRDHPDWDADEVRKMLGDLY